MNAPWIEGERGINWGGEDFRSSRKWIWEFIAAQDRQNNQNQSPLPEAPIKILTKSEPNHAKQHKQPSQPQPRSLSETKTTNTPTHTHLFKNEKKMRPNVPFSPAGAPHPFCSRSTRGSSPTVGRTKSRSTRVAYRRSVFFTRRGRLVRERGTPGGGGK